MLIISTDKKSVKPREAADLYIELGWGTSRDYTVARMRKSLANCDVVVSARNAGGELVGIGRALTDYAMDTKILDLVIAPEYQGQGIGQRMMREIEAKVKGTAAYFETEPKNFGFAHKCGYGKRGSLTVFIKKLPRR